MLDGLSGRSTPNGSNDMAETRINFDAPKPSTAKTVAEVDQVRPLPTPEKLNVDALKRAQGKG